MTAKFCPECAHPVSSVPAVEARSASPDAYTPKHLAEKILNSKAALEGERKQVTVLFADLKGSMELLADRDPEEARKILDPVLERMMEAVHRYEGTVNQVMGDGIMALFGAPLAHEDHAVRACYAALRMQESVKKYSEEVRRSHAAVVKIRVGLNSGEVVVRAIGSDLHMDYTAVGQTTHLAARMEQIADPGAIVITPDTLALAGGYVAVKSLGPIPVKGLADAVEVYEVTGAGPARTRLQASARRGLTRFVGRDAEVGQLRRAQQLAGTGHGQVAALVGEAGVGKSRLVYELTHSHRLQGWLVLESASVSYGKATGYLPVIDLLKGYFKIQDRDDLREIREKVTGKLLTLDRALEPALPALLALLDVPVDDAAWRTLDPAQRRQQTLDAVRRLLLREAREQPLLVIFEDLHWIDSETQALLDGLVESLGSARLLLLVNYRSEYEHGWGSKTYYSQLRLDALPAESAGELLEALLGDDPGLVPLKQLLVKRGNPFFLEETVRTLVEMKALAGEGGRYRLTQPVQAIQIPPTVQVMLAARIDRLSPEEKHLLQTAAVVGKDVPFGLLQAIADLPDEALRRGLDRLQSAEFLYETGLYPDLEYSFKHALTHDVTYGGLLQERRRELHARIVAAIETLHRDRLDGEIERLAHHALRAGLWDKAVDFLRQAGDRAAARSANRDAAAHLRGALGALAHVAESRHRTETAIDLRVDLCGALSPLREFAAIRELLGDAESLADALDDSQRRGRVAYRLGMCAWQLDDIDGAIAASERALNLASVAEDPALLALACDNLGRAYFSKGHYQQGKAILEQNVAALTGDLERERFGAAGFISVYSRHFLVRCCTQIGAFNEARAHAERAASIAGDHPHSAISARAALGFVGLARGQFAAAVSTLEHALELCERLDIKVWVPHLVSALGDAYTFCDRIAEALPLLERGASFPGNGESSRRGRLSVGYLQAGRIEDARATARRALSTASGNGERGVEAEVLGVLGEIALHDDPLDAMDAEGCWSRALTLGRALEMRPLLAHCHLGLAKLYRRSGKREQAQEHLATATTMYREMDMRFYLEQAEAESMEPGA
jgi:class 3 adenylate cyclase/tetratricopeptide (TPR) repeat protein